MRNLTIQSEWENYRDKVLPKDAQLIQRIECKRAFYLGAMSMFKLREELTNSTLSEKSIESVLKIWEEEMKTFAVSVKQGEA